MNTEITEKFLNKLNLEGFFIKNDFITPNLPAVLCTVGALNQPTSRTLYIKKFFDGKLYFFTSDYSNKVKDISFNPLVSLCLFFEKSFSQIIIEGKAKKESHKLAEEYFKTRSPLSKAGAILSRQSTKLENYLGFIDEAKELSSLENLTCPSFWNCYSITPHKIEFFSGNNERLHLRELFLKKQDKWESSILYP